MNKVYVVGMGIGAGNCLSPSAEELIRGSDMLVGGKRILRSFEDWEGERVEIKGPLRDIIEEIQDAWSEGKKVAVLADGDPLFFGIGKTLLKEVGPEGVEFIPNVTALQVAASKAKIAWNNLKTVSIHGRKDFWPLLRALCSQDMVGVYTADGQGPSTIATVMINKNIDTFRMTVFEDLGYDTERVRDLDLKEAEELEFSPLNFVLLRRIRDPEIPLSLGLEDDLYVHDKGMITKKEVRAACLATLAIEPGDVVWDIGAGCGSVAIEASYLARQGEVYAVEKNHERIEHIKENIRRTGAYGVEVIHGEAPQCLDSLPDPDKIFLGGGMKGNKSLIQKLCERLKPGGRVVANTVLMDSLWEIRKHVESLGWPFDVTQISVARSSSMSADLRFEALNPVFVACGKKV